tara:strand:- start:6550 stop:7179 length:630 start_codon:yes stop_codon:yes gene_type:complete
MRYFAYFGIGLVMPVLLSGVVAPALANDVACIEKFKTLVVDGNPYSGPVRIHIFQEVGDSKTENYFHSPGGSSGDGMMQPLENMGQMWVLFRDKKMYTSMDDGETWTFGQDMAPASQPEAYKDQVRNDLETADKVECGQQAVDAVIYDTVEGEYVSASLQGALLYAKYWIVPETGFIAQQETSSDGVGGKFFSLQIIERAPGLELPIVE